MSDLSDKRTSRVLGSETERGKEDWILDSAQRQPAWRQLRGRCDARHRHLFLPSLRRPALAARDRPAAALRRCGGSRFRRDSIFSARQEHGSPTAELAVPAAPRRPDWLDEARELTSGTGHFLVYRDDEGSIQPFLIERGWTRIGRSANADLRLDDPSVSRRHALIVAEPGRRLRVLDDRSLNGVIVNGVPTEWTELGDGDELAIGRFRLYLLHS